MSKQPDKKNYAALARTMINANAPAQKDKSPRITGNMPPQADRTMEMVEALVFAIIAAFFLKTFIVEAYRIPTGSMEKTLLVGDFLLVNKFLYGAKSPLNVPFTDIRLPHLTMPAMRPPQRGDVVVFIYPGDRDQLQADEVTNYIKRCVGTPGDTIMVRDKILFVNGEKFFTPPKMQFVSPMPEPRNQGDPRIFPQGSHWNHDNYGPLRVPAKGDLIPLSESNFAAWEIFIEREGHSPSLRNHTGLYRR